MLSRSHRQPSPAVAPRKKAGRKGRHEPSRDGRGLATPGGADHAEQTNVHRACRELANEPFATEEHRCVLALERCETFVGADVDLLLEHRIRYLEEPVELQP